MCPLCKEEREREREREREGGGGETEKADRGTDILASERAKSYRLVKRWKGGRSLL